MNGKSKGKDTYKWWKEKIELLSSIKFDNTTISADEIYNSILTQSSELYEKGVWTIKKLVAIQCYADVYTRIIRKHFKTIFYFDLFSGSGLVRLKDIKRCVFGSALLSILIPYYYSRFLFNKYYFVEINKRYASTLNEAIEELKHRLNIDFEYEIIPKDMNEINYSDYMKECQHSLVVIDPEGFEPRWQTASKILEHECDAMFTFMTSGVPRAKNTNAFKAFLGDESIPENIDEIMERYTEKIKSMGKEMTENIEVSSTHIRYNVIFAVKRTGRNSPWLKAINDIKKYLKIDDEDLLNIVKNVFNMGPSLDQYLNNNNC